MNRLKAMIVMATEVSYNINIVDEERGRGEEEERRGGGEERRGGGEEKERRGEGEERRRREGSYVWTSIWW